MKPTLRFLGLCLAPLALAACHGEKKTPEGATAQGEILPGSASDAMLPYDTVRSKPPLAPPTETVASGKPGKGSASEAAEAQGDVEPGAPSEGAPAAAPSIAVEPVQ